MIDPIGKVNELVAECSSSNFLSINNIADFSWLISNIWLYLSMVVFGDEWPIRLEISGIGTPIDHNKETLLCLNEFHHQRAHYSAMDLMVSTMLIIIPVMINRSECRNNPRIHNSKDAIAINNIVNLLSFISA